MRHAGVHRRRGGEVDQAGRERGLLRGVDAGHLHGEAVGVPHHRAGAPLPTVSPRMRIGVRLVVDDVVLGQVARVVDVERAGRGVERVCGRTVGSGHVDGDDGAVRADDADHRSVGAYQRTVDFDQTRIADRRRGAARAAAAGRVVARGTLGPPAAGLAIRARRCAQQESRAIGQNR